MKSSSLVVTCCVKATETNRSAKTWSQMKSMVGCTLPHIRSTRNCFMIDMVWTVSTLYAEQ